VEAGGVVVAHGRRLPAVVLLFQAAKREILPLPLVFFCFFLFFLCFVYQWLSPLSSRFVSKNSLPGFKLPMFFPSSLYISFPLFLFSPSSLPFGSFFSLFGSFSPPSPLLPFACWCWVSIYKAKGVGALYCCAWGAGQRWVGWWAQLARHGAPDFSSSRCVGRRVFRRARSSQELMKRRSKTIYLPLLHIQGKEKEEQCCSKRHYSALFFSFSF